MTRDEGEKRERKVSHQRQRERQNSSSFQLRIKKNERQLLSHASYRAVCHVVVSLPNFSEGGKKGKTVSSLLERPLGKKRTDEAE